MQSQQLHKIAYHHVRRHVKKHKKKQKGFISGCIESDGMVYGHKTPKRIYIKPIFNLEITSNNFINDFGRLLKLFEYKFSIFPNYKEIYGGYWTYNLQIGSVQYFKRLYSDFSDYFLNKSNKEKMEILIRQSNQNNYVR